MQHLTTIFRGSSLPSNRFSEQLLAQQTREVHTYCEKHLDPPYFLTTRFLAFKYSVRPDESSRPCNITTAVCHHLTVTTLQCEIHKIYGKRGPPRFIHPLTRESILGIPPGRRTDPKRKRHVPVIKRIPPRIRLPKQMPAPHRLPISLRGSRPRLRRRPRKRPARRPPRLRHPNGLRIRYRATRIVWIHIRAYPVNLLNQRRPVAVGPYFGSVDMPERPTDTSVLHGRARLADMRENR